MKSIAVIEDDGKSADIIKENLERYADESGERFNVVHFPDAVRFLTNYKANFDIVFMDIELPELDGMEASRRLRQFDPYVVLIFVTNMANYAVGGYEVGAMDFIVKPVTYNNFAVKMKRALEHIRARGEVKLMLPNKQGMTVVLASRVKYVEVMNHALTFHTLDGDMPAYGSLKKYEQQLNECHFSRCNSCYFVNLKYVTGVTGFTAHVGGEDLQISYSKRKQFLKDIADYLGGGA